MTGVYLYCAIPAGAASCDGIAGIGDGPVLRYAEDALEYWYSRLPGRPEPSIEGIRQHNAVVEAAITEQITPLPIRFGQWFESEQRLREQLADLKTLHQQKLQTFRGALEFGLRIVDPRVPAQPLTEPAVHAGGREYLLALRERQNPRLGPLAEDVAAEIAKQFGGIVRDGKVEPLRTQHGVISAAHLVPREQFAAWHRAVDALRQQFPELRFLASGPWPPYSFAA